MPQIMRSDEGLFASNGDIINGTLSESFFTLQVSNILLRIDMCTKTYLLIALMFLLGSPVSASDTQNSVGHSNENTENNFYWTQERLQNAIPTERKADIYSLPSEKSRDNEQGFISPAYPPYY